MILESLLLTAIIAILLDFKFGDPKNKYHLTAWIGILIAKLTPIAKNQQRSTMEKVGGVFVVVTTLCIVISLLLMLNFGISQITINYTLSLVISIIVGSLLLKTTIAICGMERHAKAILESLDGGSLDMARTRLSMIVKRNTKDLDRNHIISGVLESISESTVDGITGPLFYYALFGLPGAFAYRIINTADSMIGYKTDIFKNIGWFAATCDSILNYIPSRLTGLVMIIAAAILQNNWRESYKIMVRDAKKTQSLNAGYPMAALAGALETKFEKIDHYKLGDDKVILTKQHVYSAITIMKLTTILFFLMVVAPLILISSFVGRWLFA